MMSTAPTLSLTREQASRLHAYLQTYRRYAWAALLPSVDRNNVLCMLQTMQGKLTDLRKQKTVMLTWRPTAEEMAMLKAIVAELLQLYARGPESKERVATLADLAALKSCLKVY